MTRRTFARIMVGPLALTLLVQAGCPTMLKETRGSAPRPPFQKNAPDMSFSPNIRPTNPEVICASIQALRRGGAAEGSRTPTALLRALDTALGVLAS